MHRDFFFTSYTKYNIPYILHIVSGQIYDLITLERYHASTHFQASQEEKLCLMKKSLRILPFEFLRGKSTCWQKDKTPLSSTFPGSQNAWFIFLFSCSSESRRSILESSSEELILLPFRPGTKNSHTNSYTIMVLKRVVLWVLIYRSLLINIPEYIKFYRRHLPKVVIGCLK